jgi:hypothetical protein
MDEQWLVKHVVDTLSVDEAECIVADTIDYDGQFGDPIASKRLIGHRRRLAVSFSMVPKAEGPDASCLDIGRFGYMPFWAWRYVGYAQIEGVELRPELGAKVSSCSLRVGDDVLSFNIHDFDIASPAWPINRSSDTVIFLKKLERVNINLVGMRLKMAGLMSGESRLLISVQNALSYKVVQKILAGALFRGEPRHCFKRTPIFFKMPLDCAGFKALSFPQPDRVCGAGRLG